VNQRTSGISVIRCPLYISLLLIIIFLASPYISASQLSSDLSTKTKILILDPYNVDVKIAASVRDYLKRFNNVAPTYLYGTQVRIEVFEKLSDYDVIYYSGHGVIGSKTGLGAIGTGQLFSESKKREYQKRYGSNYDRYLYVNSPKRHPEQTTFWITSDFIKDLSKKLKATVVYFDACETFKNKTTAEAFIANGAKSYLGWDKGQAAWDFGNWKPTADVAKTFLRNMLNCKTVESSFNNLPFDFNPANLKWYGEGKAQVPACIYAGLTMPFEDYGACPFECCTYREWIAKKDTEVRASHKTESLVIYTIKKGQKVHALTGVVITTKPGRARVEKPISIGNVKIAKGEIVYLLTYQGEGTYKLWFKGKLINGDCQMELSIIDKPESIWWVNIQNSNGQTGWSDEPDNFDYQDACG
jgi:hypothetical protein